MSRFLRSSYNEPKLHLVKEKKNDRFTGEET
jgi:hypothetical protein